MPRHAWSALLLLLALAGAAAAARPAPAAGGGAPLRREPEAHNGTTWALLVAGSATWANFRHQGDVAHAYTVLTSGGLDQERVVVFAADDIASHPNNPVPGTIVNRPGGPDLYARLRIDYRGDAVTAANVLAVLRGDGPLPVTANSTGRVVASGPRDRVFVYYSDHGAPGVVGMPSGPFLYADQLRRAIRHKRRRGGFAEMVLFVEACESGSLFEGRLHPGAGVYAVTAANAHESSWACYCPDDESGAAGGGAAYGTCLGDLFSVSFLEDADASDLSAETLRTQFQRVRARTSQNYTYAQGSHAQAFDGGGRGPDVAQQPAADFEGRGGGGGGPAPPPLAAGAPRRAVPQRDADLEPLRAAAARAACPARRAAAAAALAAERGRRAALDAGVRAAVARLADAARGGALAAAPPVDDWDWDCLRAMVGAWERACGRLDQYGMRHTRAFAGLCAAGVAPAALAAEAAGACGAGAPAAVAAA